MTDMKQPLARGTVLSSPQRAYTIESVLGSGGFGITYRVKGSVLVDNIPMTVRFAIKEHFVEAYCSRDESKSRVVVDAAGTADMALRKNDFINEARQLQVLGIAHRNIVRVNEVFMANDTAYYVMEYLKGYTLRQYVLAHPDMTLSERLDLILPIVDAVAALHARGVLHLDIKPDNIMVTTDEDGNLRPVLIDFGLARHFDSKGRLKTRHADIGVTPGYSPAEQARGVNTFMPAIDVYSLAATTYFTLVGDNPPEAGAVTPDGVRGVLAGSATDGVIETVVDAMQFRQGDRIADVATFARRLGYVVDSGDRGGGNGPDVVKKDSLLSRPGFIAAVVAVMAGVVILMCGIAAFTFINRHEPAEPDVRHEIAQALSGGVDRSRMKNLDLVALDRRSGELVYVSRDEWAERDSSWRDALLPLGIAVVGHGQNFVLSIADGDEGEMTYDEALGRYGSGFLTKTQANMVRLKLADIAAAAYDYGAPIATSRYWTSDSVDAGHAWCFGLYPGGAIKSVGRDVGCRVLRTLE